MRFFFWFRWGQPAVGRYKTQTKRRLVGDWLRLEPNVAGNSCRETITLASNGTERTIESGTVLSAAAGKYAECNSGEDAAAILSNRVVVPAAGDVKAVAIIRGPCVVSNDGLTWSSDADVDQASAQLRALGIQVRASA